MTIIQCKKCGGKPVFEKSGDIRDTVRMRLICPNGCGNNTKLCGSKEDAVKSWNALNAPEVKNNIIRDINDLAADIHANAVKQGYWTSYDCTPKEYKPQIMSSQLMLCVTEIAEACEELRVGDDEKFKVEIADALIRILDVACMYTPDIAKVIHDKREHNKGRPPMHGKKF